ncbi:MAG: sensor histidine kinase [Bacteroides sp.]
MLTTIFYNLAMNVIEVMCCKILFETFCEKRKRKNDWSGNLLIILLIFICFLYSNMPWMKAHLLVKMLVGITATATVMWGYFQTDIRKAFIITILFYGLITVADFIVYIMVYSFFLNDDFIRENYLLEGLLIVAFGKIFDFIIILFIKKNFGHKSVGVMTDAEWIRLMIFPVFTIVTLTAMVMNFRELDNTAQENVLVTIALGMVAMNIMVYYLINDIINRETQLREKTVTETRMKNELAMYRSISDNYETQRRRSHEFKNQIMCIESLMQNGEYEKLEQYVKNISHAISVDKNTINSNNVIVNAILNTKYTEAIEKGIVFTFMVNDLSNIRISDEDIVVILSNLLNNAIEACEKCTGRKIIKLKFVKEKQIILSVKNTCAQKLVFEDGEIVTTKKLNREEHGIGVKNIKNTVEKYGGEYSIKNENNEFSFSICFPMG